MLYIKSENCVCVTKLSLKLKFRNAMSYTQTKCQFRRNDAKKALKAMMGHQDFDTLFYQDVDWKIIGSIEKQLVLLKYNQTHGT